MKSKLIIHCYIIFSLIFIFLSCNTKTDSLTPEHSKEIKYNVQKMMDSIANDINRNGPTAWLKYFENTPEFFMASEGQLVFPNNEIAIQFIKNELVKQISKMNLRWTEVQIDVLTNKFVNVAAKWNEDITNFENKTTSQGGYFTGIAKNTSEGWKLRNAHWSVTNKK
ncbi:MAG TPA: hypothetical protein VK590_01765 [Saprospiraceae bacterium]|nr:hypothetical protein [Saprospiraceae bacterium]